MSKSRRILFQLSGSIAAYKACEIISTLMKAGHNIQTVATPSALQFIGPATLEGLTGQPVLSDLFQQGRTMDHIHLARSNDLILLCPATANSINSLAAGLANDLVGALFLANNFKTPYWIVPAMNSEMWAHPATQKSVGTLKEWGVRVFDTQEGRLACGEEGWGKMLEPKEIVAEIEKFLGSLSK